MYPMAGFDTHGMSGVIKLHDGDCKVSVFGWVEFCKKLVAKYGCRKFLECPFCRNAQIDVISLLSI